MEFNSFKQRRNWQFIEMDGLGCLVSSALVNEELVVQSAANPILITLWDEVWGGQLWKGKKMI
jgi:hypothetical protein